MNWPSERYMKRWDYKNDPISPKKSGSLQFFCTFRWFKGSVVNAAKCLAKKGEAAASHVRIMWQVAESFAFQGAAIYIQINEPHATLSIRSVFPSTGHQQIRYASYTSIFSNKLWTWRIKWDIENQNWVELLPSCNKSFHSTAFLAHLPRPLCGVGRLLRLWRCTGFQWQRCKPKRLLRNTGLLGLVENQKTQRPRDRCPKNGP